MFLSVLSGVVVALALLAQVDHFDRTFTVAAALLLLIVLFVGVATIVRLSALNREDLRLVMGMNRLRRAYLDMHPELEPYFLMGSHDDLPGVMLTMDMHMAPDHWSAVDAGHEFQTLPAMLGVVVAVIAGVLGAVLAGWFGAETPTLVVVAATVFLLSIAVLGYWTRRTFTSFVQQMPTRFASTQSAQGCTQRRPSEASSSSAAAGPQEPAG